MQKIAYILSEEMSHHLFFSQALGKEYECFEIAPKDLILREFKQYLMDLVVIHDALEGQSLYALLRAIRNSPDLVAIPIIIITTQLKKNIHKKLKRAGATTILLEPLSQEDLSQALTEAAAFHHVVEKTANVRVFKMSKHPPACLQHESIIDTKVIKSVQKSLRNSQDFSLVMAKIVPRHDKNLCAQEYSDLQTLIAKEFCEKTLFFLSKDEFFFTSILALEALKSHCKTIKNILDSKNAAVCYGIATKKNAQKGQSLKEYLSIANKNLDKALHQPNTMIIH